MGVGMLNIFGKDIGDNRFPHNENGLEVIDSIKLPTIFDTIFIDYRKTVRLIAGIVIRLAYAFAYGFIKYLRLMAWNNEITYGGLFMSIGCSGVMLIYIVDSELIISKQYSNFFALYLGSIIVTIPTSVMT